MAANTGERRGGKSNLVFANSVDSVLVVGGVVVNPGPPVEQDEIYKKTDRMIERLLR
jgi:hypothetical protein